MRFRIFAICAALLAVAAAVSGGVDAASPAPGSTRNLMCRKGGFVKVKLSRMVYMPGQKRFESFFEVPTRGKMFGYDGADYNIRIKTIDDANKYIANKTLFPSAGAVLTREQRSKLRKQRKLGAWRSPRFRYYAPVVRDENGTATAFPTGTPMDYLRFRASVYHRDQQTSIDATVAIDVVNSRPRAVPVDMPIAGGKPRYVALPAQDIDAPNVDPVQEITAAWVTVDDVDSNACRLSATKGDQPFDFRARRSYNVSAANLRVYVMPPRTTSSFNCKFTYTVADSGGLVSETAPVTLTAGSTETPKAFASQVRLRSGRTRVVVDLYGSSGNIDRATPMNFVVTALPQYGLLYKVDNIEEEPLPSQVLKMPATKPKEIIVSNTTARRVRLVFEATPKFYKRQTSEPFDLIKYYVDDGAAKSEVVNIRVTAPGGNDVTPVCNDTTIEHVIQAESRVVRLAYGYTGPVSLPDMRRLKLVSAPKKASLAKLGKLQQEIEYANGTSYVDVKLGAYFNDADRKLRWVPNPNASLVTAPVMLRYSYRAFAPSGKSCTAQLNIVVEPQMKPAGTEGTSVPTVIEMANTGRPRLIVLQAADAPNATMAIAKITQLPDVGRLYLVTDSLPVARLPLKTGGGKAMRRVCATLNCTDFKGARIEAGDEVEALVDSRAGFRAVVIMYEAPEDQPEIRQAIEFKYKTSRSATWSGLQHITLFVAQGPLPTLKFDFSAPGRSDPGPADVRVLIKFDFDPKKFAVAVLDFDMRRRHNARPTYGLYQMRRMDGNRPIVGDRLVPLNLHSMKLKWARRNSLVLLPFSTNYKHSYTFRVRVFGLTASGNIDASKRPTTYRVVVQQRNHGLRWDLGTDATPTGVSTIVGFPVNIPLLMIDQEDNLVTYRLIRAPRWGVLRFPTVAFNRVTFKTLREGMSFRVRKGSAFRQLAVVQYQCDGAETAEYPLSDSFVVTADDGNGVLAKPLKIDVHVGASPNAVHQREETRHDQGGPSPATAIAGVVMFLLVTISVTYVVVRRQKFKIYEALATGGADLGNAPHPGVRS